MKRALEIKLQMGIMKCLGSYSEQHLKLKDGNRDLIYPRQPRKNRAPLAYRRFSLCYLLFRFILLSNKDCKDGIFRIISDLI
jgi:hypothetical protein